MKATPSPLTHALALLPVLATLPLGAHGAALTTKPTDAVSYYRDIRPIFQANCQACHQPAKPKGGYVMTDFQKMLAGGEKDGVAIVPGNTAKGSLIEQITPTNGAAEMPKNKPPLQENELALIRRWISEGAKDDTPADAKKHFDAEHPPVYGKLPVVTSIDYSPDGKLLAVAAFHEIVLHNADGSGLVGRLIGISERIQSVRFSPDGKWLAAAGGDPSRLGEVQIWDVATKSLKLSIPTTWDTTYGVSWSPDSKLVAFGCADNTVRTVEAETGKQVLQMGSHNDWVLDTAFSLKGDHVISVGRDMTAKLSELPTQRFVDNITSITPGALRGGMNTVDRHPAQDAIVVGGADGSPQVFKIFRTTARKIGDNANLIRKYPDMLGRVFSARFSADGQSFVAASSLNGRGEVSIFTMPADLSAPKEIEALRAKAPKQRTPEEEQRLKDFESKAGVRTAQTFVESSAVYTVAFHPSGKEIAAAGSDGKVRIIRAADGAISTEFASVPLEKKGAETNVARASIRAVAPETLAPDKPHAAANLACIEIQPREIRIERANDYVQMLVTARYQDGTSADITRSAKIELSSPVADVTPRGQLHPKNDGAAELRVSFGNKSASVPVVVKGSTSRFAADFVRDVNPVMTKLGCNQGTCHGSKEGKGGFKLSLRGYDPEYDLRSLTDDMASRRVAVASPDDSLMLLKAVAEVPHEGGRRTHVDEKYYHILRQWIADGAPLDTQSVRPSKIELSPQNPVIQEIGSRQQFRVIAHFPDGSQRDVSNEAFLESGNTDVAAVDGNGLLSTLRRGEAPILARYEGNYIATTVTVMGDRTGFQWKEPVTWTRADELVAAKWKRMQIEPSDVCTDGEFLRRIYLDLTGLPPSAEQLRTFLADPRESRVKRESVVDTLVGSPDFVEHWTNKWSDLLQVNSKFLGKQGAEGFRAWIRTQLEKNTPYDQFAKAILTAEGSNKDNPAASYWKILRQPTEAMENTTHLFLATRFNCNKCHDHPFERWTQDQYYQTAAYFAQFTLAEDPASAGAKIGGTAVEGAKPLFEIVKENPQGQIKHDRTGKLTPPEFPYPAKAEIEEKANRRTQLAQWMTSPDNRYFASSYVNRIWGYLLGRGIIEPLDDIRAGNPPTNPELLEHLTQEFIRSGFDTRSVFKTICKSRTYQLSIRTNQWNEDDSVNYSHAIARRLPAETLFDSVFKVTGATATLPGMSAGGRAAMLVESSSDGAGGFLATLGRPTRESTCECERNSNLGLGSVMALLSGPTISSAIQDPKNELARLVSKQPDDSVLVNELFERVLSRSATPRELEATMKLMGTIDTDHKQVSEALAQKEKEQAPIIAAMEKERVSAIAKAKLNLENYEAATKNLREERESVRKDRQARADLALKAWEAALPTRVAGWLALSKPETLPVRWTKLQPKSAATTGAGLKLAIEKDGTLIASGNPARTDYNLSFETPVEGITAMVLEILPDPASPQFGPGRGKNGSFVLNEFTLQAGSPAAKQPLKSARIAKAWASSEQQKMGIALAIDGKEDEPQNGWSIANTPGQRHFAVFQLEKPLAFGAPTSLNVRLTHRSADGIGRFRIHVTTAENPLGEGIPAEVAAAAERASSERSAEEKATLEAYVRLTDAEHWRLSRELAEAKVPLNPDTLHTELQSVLAKASEPIRLDPKLVQLRIDAAASTQQVANKRLTVVQDLTWALINNPAFLFNR